MTATLPFTGNRIAAHSETPEPALPQSARERGKLWSDTVFQAVLALKKQLRSPDARIVAAAATSILELERTRMRHGASVAGSEEVSEAQEEFEADRRSERELPRGRGGTDSANDSDFPPEVPEDEEAFPTLAEHAREARRVLGESGFAMTEPESLRFTENFLKQLGRNGTEVSRAEFAAILRSVRENRERAKTARLAG